MFQCLRETLQNYVVENSQECVYVNFNILLYNKSHFKAVQILLDKNYLNLIFSTIRFS